MSAPNFVLISELQTLSRRDFPLTDTSILQPSGSNPLIDGEYLELDTSYQLIRAGAGTTFGGTHEAIQPSYPVSTERGRYDTQAIGKVNVLYGGMFEAETVVCDVSSLNLGDALTVQDVTVSALTRRGLKKIASTSGHSTMVVGFVSKLYTGVTKVRFVHQGFQRCF